MPLVKGQPATMLYTTDLAPGAPLDVYGISIDPAIRLRLYQTTNTGNFTFTVLMNGYEPGIDYFMALSDPISQVEDAYVIQLVGPFVKFFADPNAYQVVYVPGATSTIKWRGIQLDGLQATILLLANGTFDRTIVASIPANAWAYNWTVPTGVTFNPNPMWYSMRIQLTNAGYERVIYDSEYIRIWAGTVSFTFPDTPYRMLRKNVPTTITWSTSGSISGLLNLDVVYQSNRTLVFAPVATAISNTGSHIWTPSGTLPTVSTLGNALRFRLSSQDGNLQFFSTTFLLTTVGFNNPSMNPPLTQLPYFLQTGLTYTLTWTTDGVSPTVSIGYDQFASDTASNIIAPNIANTGSYTFTAPPNAAIASSVDGVPVRIYVIAGSDATSFITVATTQKNGVLNVLAPYKLNKGQNNRITYNISSAVSTVTSVNASITDFNGHQVAPIADLENHDGEINFLLPIDSAPADSSAGNMVFLVAANDASINGQLPVSIQTVPVITINTQPANPVVMGATMQIAWTVTLVPSAHIFGRITQNGVYKAALNSGNRIFSPHTFVLTPTLVSEPGIYQIVLATADNFQTATSASFVVNAAPSTATSAAAGTTSGVAAGTTSTGAPGTTSGSTGFASSATTGSTTSGAGVATTSTGSTGTITTGTTGQGTTAVNPTSSTSSSSSSSGVNNAQNQISAAAGTGISLFFTLAAVLLGVVVSCF